VARLAMACGWLRAAESPPLWVLIRYISRFLFVEDIELAVFFEIFVSEFCLFV
jgi:hypothetical protein